MLSHANPDVNLVIDSVYRSDWGRAVATLIRLVGDFDVAEEAAQEAFMAAVNQWQATSVPEYPRTWIIQTARYKANDRLRLIFTCCHPALALEAQVALTLRMLGGIETDEIARAFLVPTPTMARRLVRAKRKMRAVGIPYTVPDTNNMPARLDAVRTVIYLVCNEGYVATRGEPLVRVDLCAEAIRLGRLVKTLMAPQPPAEVTGLIAACDERDPPAASPRRASAAWLGQRHCVSAICLYAAAGKAPESCGGLPVSKIPRDLEAGAPVSIVMRVPDSIGFRGS
jgi:RNA polymerase sigma-70 factor, ECF subfamily